MATDFSTLYTKIPLNKLFKSWLYEVTYFCFDGAGSTHVTVTKYKTKWISDASTNHIPFNKSLYRAMKYLLDILFKFGRRIYKQILGIPMESDPAPLMAYLCLYYYEDKWIWKKEEKTL